MMARRHRGQTRAPRGAWLAFLAVALQVLVPFFLMAEIARADKSGGIAVICSGLGHQTQSGSNNAGDQGLADHCPICTTLAAAQGFAPPAAAPLPLPATIGGSALAVADISAPALLVNSPYQSRGPPSIA